MANIGGSDDEDEGSKDGDSDDSPEGPNKTTSRVADPKHCNADAGFNRDGAGGVEELGNEEELTTLVLRV